jgi:antitoxin ParD1/3/4
MTSINISLPESMKAYIEEQVTSGGYGTVSEYIRELIRQDRKRKAKEHLEALLLEGLDSGSATAMTDRDWEDIRQVVRDKIVQHNLKNPIDGEGEFS